MTGGVDLLGSILEKIAIKFKLKSQNPKNTISERF